MNKKYKIRLNKHIISRKVYHNSVTELWCLCGISVLATQNSSRYLYRWVQNKKKEFRSILEGLKKVKNSLNLLKFVNKLMTLYLQL